MAWLHGASAPRYRHEEHRRMSVSPDILRKRIEAKREERARYEALEKERRDRERVVREAYDHTPMQFWCDECERDYETIGHKVVQEENRFHLLRAYYVGICPASHRNIRRITDKQGDPYYHKSIMLRRQRIDMADAMLQPHDPRFRVVYPDAWRRIEADREAREQAERERISAGLV